MKYEINKYEISLEPNTDTMNWEKKSTKSSGLQLKTEEKSSTINSIETENGTVMGNPKEINDCFKYYYASLFTWEFSSDLITIDSFLSSAELSGLTEEDQEEINCPFTQTETEKAISS